MLHDKTLATSMKKKKSLALRKNKMNFSLENVFDDTNDFFWLLIYKPR